MEDLETQPDGLETQPKDLETQPQDTPEPEPAQDSAPDSSPADAEEAAPETAHEPPQTISIEEWMAAASQASVEEELPAAALEDVQLLAVLEACVYVVEEPLMPAQIAAALNQDPERIRGLMQQLMAEFERPEHGVSIKEVAGGYKMATKPEHHEAVRSFVKSLKAPLKLSLPALETLAVVAYKQPVTSPEIMEIRGVQGGGVLKTLLDRKLITESGRKNVIGKPILYKTTKEFLIQFGLKDLSELPTLKEFEEIRRMAFADNETPLAEAAPEVPAANVETLRAVRSAPAEQSTPDVEIVEGEAPRTESEVAGPVSEAAVPQSEAPVSEAETSEVRTVDPEAPRTEPQATESEIAEPVEEAAAPQSDSPISEAANAGITSVGGADPLVRSRPPGRLPPEVASMDAEAAPQPEAHVEAPATESEVSTPEFDAPVPEVPVVHAEDAHTEATAPADPVRHEPAESQEK